MSCQNKDKTTAIMLEKELAQLRQENAALKESNRRAYAYIRSKVDRMLEVIGTQSLKPEELDDRSLVEFDPIGIVADSFQHVLENLRLTNQQLHFVNNEIQAIFDTVGAALLVLDPQQRIVAYNQKADELLINHQEHVLGQRCLDVICRDRKGKGDCAFKQVMASGREQQFQEWCLQHRNFSVIGRPIHDESGKVSHVVLSYTDNTARKNAEVALLEALTETQEANAKIHGILRSVYDCLLITDADNKVVLINRRAEELFGFCLADSGQTPGLDILPNDELAELIRRARAEQGDLLIEDLDFATCKDEEQIYQARVSVIRSPRGSFRGCITFLHDVTEDRAVEQMKSEFVSTAAHELRTPLATIIGYTDLLLTEETQTQETLKEHLSLIQSKAERLAQIVGDLLDISRIEAGEGLKLKPGPVSLKALCADVLGGIDYSTTGHQLEVELPNEPDFVVQADRYAFAQVVENVLSNAIKYSPEGGEITLSANAQNGMCRLSISDQGIGMTSDQIEKVYEKFYRADATNTAISGTGLGMTIVKHLVEAQQGQIEIDSQPGRGTTVHVSLPLVDGEASMLH